MSRIGKHPIQVPEGTTVSIAPQQLTVKGPKGELKCPVPRGVEFSLENGTLEARAAKGADPALWGLARALANNAVTGVTKGFQKELEIVGIGFRAQAAGRVVVFNLGYSHAVEVLMPEGVDIRVENQTKITVSGIDKELVGQTAANIRNLRPPDPYKNKGVRYVGERLRKKEGKAGSK